MKTDEAASHRMKALELNLTWEIDISVGLVAGEKHDKGRPGDRSAMHLRSKALVHGFLGLVSWKVAQEYCGSIGNYI
jgi:hypothetical protein